MIGIVSGVTSQWKAAKQDKHLLSLSNVLLPRLSLEELLKLHKVLKLYLLCFTSLSSPRWETLNVSYC